MTTPASGVFKTTRYKKESSYGVAPGQSGGQLLRRVTSGIALTKDTYESNEINPTLQTNDYRHGVRRVAGSIAGELSPGTYSPLLGSLLKRDFSAISAITGLTLTIAIVSSGPTYTVTRSTGDFLAGGIKSGMVVRLTGASLDPANVGINLFVSGVTALALTVQTVNGDELVEEAAIASCTVTVTGKVTYIPATGHTNDSYAFEDYFSDLGQSELFLGCRVASAAIDLPPTGMSTITLDIRGKDMAETAAKRGAVDPTDEYFTSPTAATTTTVFAAVNGIVRLAGGQVANLTGLNFTINSNFTGDPVVGANTVPNQFPGRVMVDGQASVYFDDVTVRDAFVAETEADILMVFSSSNEPDADCMAFAMYRVKFGGAQKDDGEKGIVQTVPFKALYNRNGGASLATPLTTIHIQDTTL